MIDEAICCCPGGGGWHRAGRLPLLPFSCSFFVLVLLLLVFFLFSSPYSSPSSVSTHYSSFIFNVLFLFGLMLFLLIPILVLFSFSSSVFYPFSSSIFSFSSIFLFLLRRHPCFFLLSSFLPMVSSSRSSAFLFCPPPAPPVTTHLSCPLPVSHPPWRPRPGLTKRGVTSAPAADELGCVSSGLRHLAEGPRSCTLEEPLGRLPGGCEQV